MKLRLVSLTRVGWGWLLLGLAALLCSCARPAHPAPTRPFVGPPAAEDGVNTPEEELWEEVSPLPPQASLTLWVNGVNLEGVYTHQERLFASAEELGAAIGAVLQTPAGKDPREAVALCFSDGESLEFSVGSTGEASGLLTKEEGFLLPCDVLTQRGFHRYEEGGAVYYTPYPTGDNLPAGVTVPTLMYHAVSDDCWGIRSLFVSPASMEEQLKYLTENGYTPIFFEDLARADTIEKPVLLTFDDGYDDNYLHLFPLLKKYNVKANVFLITGSVGKEHFLTEEQIRQMQASGLVSFQSHTVYHPFLDELDEEALHRELSESKAAIARLTGREPFVLCYPSGRYDALALKVTKEYYSFALLMQNGRLYSTDDDPYHVRREYVQRSTTLPQFVALLNG